MSLIDWHPIIGPIREGLENDRANDPDQSEGEHWCSVCGAPVDVAEIQAPMFFNPSDQPVCSTECALKAQQSPEEAP